MHPDRALAVFALVLLAATAQQRTLVVDQAAGPFTAIQSAIAASRSGDRIEVHAGTYFEALTITHGLEIYGVGNVVVGASPFMGQTSISIGVGQAVRLDSLHLTWVFSPSFFGISNCDGFVHLHAVQLDVVCTISNSSRVTITDSTIVGPGRLSNVPGWPGLQLTNASVVLDHSSVLGGTGGQDQGVSPPGGVGLTMASASDVLLASATVQGGTGGQGSGFAGSGGGGGDGVSGDTSCVLRAVGLSALSGGLGGNGVTPSTNGPPGVPVASRSAMPLRLGPQVPVPGGTSTVVAIAEPPAVVAPRTFAQGTVTNIQVDGVANLWVLLGLDIWNDAVRIGGVELPFLLPSSAMLVGFAAPGAANSTSFPLGVPSSPVVARQFVHLQAVTLDANGALQFSTGGYGRIQ